MEPLGAPRHGPSVKPRAASGRKQAACRCRHGNSIHGVASWAVIAALFAAMPFAVGKSAIGWHLGREATVSTYGTAGALALVLL